MTLAQRPIERWGLLIKAAADLVIASFVLLVVLPVAVAIAAAIKLESTGPVLFRQRRHGRNNTEFDILKFRTMTVGTAPNDGSVQTDRVDRRVTRVGRFLRRTSLDELPQLLNVIHGDMSLVGPRPHPIAMRTQDRLSHEIIAEYAHRHRVKPGITGWAQINGSRGPMEKVEHVCQRIDYDLYYVENWSLLLDIKILILTPYRLIVDRDKAY